MNNLRIAVVLVFAFCFTAQAQTPVYLYPAGEDSGFIDSTRISSTLKDLHDAIAKRKDIREVNQKEDAAILIELVNSGPVPAGTESATSVHRGIFGGINSTTTTTQQTLPNITVVLHVKNSDYTKEIWVTRQMFWKDLAKNIVNQIGDWARLNQGKLQP